MTYCSYFQYAVDVGLQLSAVILQLFEAPVRFANSVLCTDCFDLRIPLHGHHTCYLHV